MHTFSFKSIAIGALVALGGSYASAQEPTIESATVPEIVNAPELEMDSLLVKLQVDSMINVDGRIFPQVFYLPMVFDSYDLHIGVDSLGSVKMVGDTTSVTRWVDDVVDTNERFRRFKQRYMIENPQLVVYNIETLPEAPKQYVVHVDPSHQRISIEEIKVDMADVNSEVGTVEIKRVNWLQSFDGMLQFSQAYNSPNWYQGGNNNLNFIGGATYNIKLNQKFYPNLLFDNTIQYKLGINSAPDDSIRNYSISEDLLQINSKFGIKAAKRWYYSATLQFKTQLLNNYKPNTRDLKAAFLSPGELTIGLGMTYDYTSPSKSFTLNASMAPLSYNLRICTNKAIDPTQFGIKPGHTTVSQYGSNIDCKMAWKLAYNIDFVSRLAAFTDYSYIQADWENTLSFSINRFLSTQIYVHLRYDSSAPSYSDWHKLQLKEILSFGFSYKFATV